MDLRASQCGNRAGNNRGNKGLEVGPRPLRGSGRREWLSNLAEGCYERQSGLSVESTCSRSAQLGSQLGESLCLERLGDSGQRAHDDMLAGS